MKIKCAAAKRKQRAAEGGGANKHKESLQRQAADLQKQIERGEFADMVNLIELLEQADLYQQRLKECL